MGTSPGGLVVKDLPDNTGDMSLIPGTGRPHMPRSNEATTTEPMLQSPEAATTEPMCHNY